MTTFDLALVERNTIVMALEHFGRNISAASKALGISRDKLYRKLRQYYIPAPSEAPLRTTGAVLPPIEERRRIDRYRSNKLALRRAYYQFLRETGRVSSSAVGIESKVKDLLEDVERFGGGEHPLVTKMRKILADLQEGRPACG